jgi:hypothetical protein
LKASEVMGKVTKTPTCWLWTGYTNEFGYGRLKIDGRYRSAHRVIYELLVGMVDPDLHLDHLCRNRKCVNPAHLEPVTPRVNILRGVGAPANNARMTHCKYGHPFTPENTMRWVERGVLRRRCRRCKYDYVNQRRAAKTSSATGGK